MKGLRVVLAFGMSLGLGACAITVPPGTVPAEAPPQWYAPLPHNGAVSELARWWQQLEDRAARALGSEGLRQPY